MIITNDNILLSILETTSLSTYCWSDCHWPWAWLLVSLP